MTNFILDLIESKKKILPDTLTAFQVLCYSPTLGWAGNLHSYHLQALTYGIHPASRVLAGILRLPVSSTRTRALLDFTRHLAERGVIIKYGPTTLEHVIDLDQSIDISNVQLNDIDSLAFSIFNANGIFKGLCYRNQITKSAYSRNGVHPSTLLYGYDLAVSHILRQGYAILVEGMFDVLYLHQSGLCHTVGSLGTNLSPFQASLLARVCPTVFIVYDGDPAGQHASIRAAERLRGMGVSPYIVELPPGVDPDDFVRTYGTEEFLSLCTKSLDQSQTLLSNSAV